MLNVIRDTLGKPFCQVLDPTLGEFFQKNKKTPKPLLDSRCAMVRHR
jgi:hypothetical protein